MKRFLTTATLIGAVIFANAQSELTFKPFKFDVAAGYAMPGGSGTKGGFLFAFEPKYAISDQLTFGLRIEAALTARGAFDPYGEVINGDVKASSYYLATADYYFNTNGVRPFAGAGVGLFQNAAADINATTDEIQTGNKFGFAPRVGIETGHFRAAVEYNVAGKTAGLNNNYLGVKLGFFLGGGRYSN